MDGFEVMKRHKDDHYLQHVPVIMTDSGNISKGRPTKMWAAYFLNVQFSPSQLRAIINKVLGLGNLG